MLVRCLYASRAAHPVEAAGLDAILRQARDHNPRRGITGLLCHTDAVFVQVLEGGRDAVSDLLAALMRDDRHHGLRLLAYDEIAERRFGHWAMGQVNLARINQAIVLKYCEMPVVDPFACPARGTLALLDELVATASIAPRAG